jgi:hypothetical protein
MTTLIISVVEENDPKAPYTAYGVLGQDSRTKALLALISKLNLGEKVAFLKKNYEKDNVAFDPKEVISNLNELKGALKANKDALLASLEYMDFLKKESTDRKKFILKYAEEWLDSFLDKAIYYMLRVCKSALKYGYKVGINNIGYLEWVEEVDGKYKRTNDHFAYLDRYTNWIYEKEIRAKIQELSEDEISFDWIGTTYAKETTRHDPKKVLKEIQTIRKTLQVNSWAFPKKYTLKTKDGWEGDYYGSTSFFVWLDGVLGHLEIEEYTVTFQSYSYEDGPPEQVGRKIDVKDRKKLKVLKAVKKPHSDENKYASYDKGEEETYEIITHPLHEWAKDEFDGMEKVCNFAIKHNLKIHPDL